VLRDMGSLIVKDLFLFIKKQKGQNATYFAVKLHTYIKYNKTQYFNTIKTTTKYNMHESISEISSRIYPN